MTDLTTFAALQARVYEFLGHQDEETLLAIIDGTAQLAIADAAARPAPAAPAAAEPAPSDDPQRVARHLASLPTEQERRIYLNATKLTVSGLGKVAKALGMSRYSKLSRARLVDLLVSRDPTPSPAAVAQPERLAPVTTPDAPPPTMADVDPAAVAARLRETETEEQGAEYLREQRLDHGTLLAVAAELQLTRVDRLRPAELEKRVLKQAIGARRKFSGLRKW